MTEEQVLKFIFLPIGLFLLLICGLWILALPFFVLLFYVGKGL